MVYIQSDSERKLPHHFDAACALYGAIDSGLDFRLTSFEEVACGKYDKLITNNLFVGSTEFMQEVFKRVNKTNVRLPKNSNRPFILMTLGSAFEMAKGSPIFIKPLEIKLFTGLVLDGMEYTSLNGLPQDTMVMVYAPFRSKLVSEWRVYIHKDNIVDSRNYSGDFTQGINYDYVREVIEVNFPIAYTIDIGVLENGDNVVVEFNDMWAIGNYGIPNDIYLRLLKERYFEIVKS